MSHYRAAVEGETGGRVSVAQAAAIDLVTAPPPGDLIEGENVVLRIEPRDPRDPPILVELLPEFAGILAYHLLGSISERDFERAQEDIEHMRHRDAGDELEPEW